MQAEKFLRGLFLALLSVIAAACGEPQIAESNLSATEPESTIARVRAFSLGGKPTPATHTGIQGDIVDEVFSGQISVLAVLADSDSAKPPMVMMPGFGLAASIYLETPDGREGWAMDAVRRGHDVYLVEPAHSARAGINPDPYTAAQLGTPTETPVLFTWGREHVWKRWGLGPEYPVFFSDSRFPEADYDNVIRMYSAVDVGSISGPSMIEFQLEDNVVGVTELLQTIGPAVLVVHSAAGVAGFEVARRQPSEVLAVVNVEPVGCPTEDIDRWSGTAVLSVFGDHMEMRPQMPVRQDECQETVDHLRSLGTPAAMFALPKLGIEGNSHLLMSENNSSDLMNRILDWLDEQL